MENCDRVCPICGSKAFQKKDVSETFQYKGQSLTVENYTIHECSDCHEAIVDNQTIKETEKIIRDFHREVDGLLTSQEIRAIRRRCGFTQEDFGELLGGGKKAFARYESGKVTQSRPMDNLIRIIHDNPMVIHTLIKKNSPEFTDEKIQYSVSRRSISVVYPADFYESASIKYQKAGE